MNTSTETKRVIFLLFGISGAGKSTARIALEDLGFSAMGMLPVALGEALIPLVESREVAHDQLALQFDVTSSDDVKTALRFLDACAEKQWHTRTVYLDAAPEVVMRRYSETRRPHPRFDPATDSTVEEAMRRERSLLLPLKERADIVFDTSGKSVHDLRRELREFVVGIGAAEESVMRVHFQSFGFKYGLPRDCDLVVDVRFLKNPHFIPDLRPQTGQDAAVQSYVYGQEAAQEFLEKYLELLQFLIPLYSKEGKAYVNVAVGCTGGKHRSVALAERLASELQGGEYPVSVSHRDSVHW